MCPFLSGTAGPASFGLPGVTFAGPAVATSIGIRLDFSLTPGDQASFTSIFTVQPQQNIPEPATVTLMGIALVGLTVVAARRRARR